MSKAGDPSSAQTPAPAPALDVAGVSYRYGQVTALDAVGFTIAPGSFTVLLGPNGAGKTTLFSLITRLYTTRQGRIRVFGHDVARTPCAALARLGVVFQQPTLDLDLTVRQCLAYHGALHGLPGRTVRARGAAELDRVGLADRGRHQVRALSGGQRRRIEIARALLHQPRLLLLDEASAGLDIESRQVLLDHVRRLCREEGLAVLWATHLIDELRAEDDLVVLHRGRRLAFDRVSRVCESLGAEGPGDAYNRLIAAAEAEAEVASTSASPPERVA